MRRVFITGITAVSIATAAIAAPVSPASAAPRRVTAGSGVGQYFIGGGSLTDGGIVALAAPIRRSASTSWSYNAGMVFSAGTGCPTTSSFCYASSGTVTLADGTSSLTANLAGTEDSVTGFTWTITVNGGTGDWRHARGTIRVTGTRDAANGQQTLSSWDLSALSL